jgi:hypothetical protein
MDPQRVKDTVTLQQVVVGDKGEVVAENTEGGITATKLQESKTRRC